MTRRFKLVVAYLGTGFAGWQRQPGERTVQHELETALGRLLGRSRPPTVVAAGRTDAGVHATGQVVHVDLPAGIPAGAVQAGLDVRLPHDVRIVSARAAGADFHARFDAVGKRYDYRLARRRSTRPWADLRHAVVDRTLDLALLEHTVAKLVGRHDVASFSVVDPGVGDTSRTLFAASCRPTRRGARMTFIGDGFLRYQVRRMVGAALDVATGARPPEWFDELLHTPTPGTPLRTAAASGLTLEKVWYRWPPGRPTVW